MGKDSAPIAELNILDGKLLDLYGIQRESCLFYQKDL